LVLFVLAIWSTYRQGTVSSKRLRWVTIILFIDLLIHFITRSLEFSRARLERDTKEEFLKWSIPLTVIGNVTTTIAGLLSDGTLAWRFYIIFDRAKWALYLPSAAVAVNALLCWSADFQHLAAYRNEDFYEQTLLPVTLDITVAWGWSMFFANSLMTGGIIYKIMWANRAVQGFRSGRRGTSRKYATALQAIIESALVTWLGIVILEIALLGPTGGHIIARENVGLVVVNIIPIFFGVSQSLITARLGLAREIRDADTTVYSSRSDGHSNTRPPTFNVFTNVTTVTDSQLTQVELEETKTEAIKVVA